MATRGSYTVGELIKYLQTLPAKTPVCRFDHTKDIVIERAFLPEVGRHLTLKKVRRSGVDLQTFTGRNVAVDDPLGVDCLCF